MRFPVLVFGFAPFALLPFLALNPQTANNRRPPHPAAQGGAVPMPPDRAADSYAIYSMLMPGQEFASMSPEQNGQWAIAEITVNSNDRNPAIPPQGQLKPPPEHPQWFQEAVQDYQANQYQRVQLTKDPFTISHAFMLLSPNEVNDLRGAKSATAANSEEQSHWADFPGITFFSEVYFDTHHHAALVYMNDWCAHLCAAGSWIYLEKQGSQWVRRSGIVSGGA